MPSFLPQPYNRPLTLSCLRVSHLWSKQQSRQLQRPVPRSDHPDHVLTAPLLPCPHPQRFHHHRLHVKDKVKPFGHLELKSKHSRGKCSKRRKTTRFSDSSSSSTSSSSPDQEEGELSGEETDEPKRKRDRLFPSKLLDKMVDKSAACLTLHRASELDSDSDPDRSEAFPRNDSKQTVFPFPKAFGGIFSKEWCAHPKVLGVRFMDKFYSLPEKQMTMF